MVVVVVVVVGELDLPEELVIRLLRLHRKEIVAELP
jgi:hypothetical protein